MKCAKAKPDAEFINYAQKSTMLVSGGAFMALKPHLNTWPEAHQVERKSAGGLGLPVPLTLRRRGTMEDSVPDVLQSTSSSPSSSSVVQSSTLPKYFGSMERLYFQ